MKKFWTYGGILLIIGMGYWVSQKKEVPASDIETEEKVMVEEIVPIEENLLYGINVDELDIIEGIVKRNQTLSTILAPFNVPYQIIDEIAKKSAEIFDVKKIAFNKKYTVLTPKDSLQAQFFIYEPNPTEFVVFKLDRPEIYLESKPMEIVNREIGGTINSSLYVNMTQLGLTPDLIDQFADLYGWVVDFQRLQKGDKFKVVFKEQLVESQTVGIEDIEAAYFEHMGQGYHAIPFEQNGIVSYFDQEGNSLKKAFLRDPLRFTRISSRYSLSRFHPVQKRYKAHLGTDYAAPRGTEIRTVGDGTVLEAGYSRGNGNYVKIKHNGTYSTQYLHMTKIGKGIRKGARVKQGQVIGYVGSTGLATGPHLCFRFWKHGKQVDWLREDIPPAEPIADENLQAFELVKLEKIAKLSAIPYTEKTELLTSSFSK
ncbi:M23 family metallopeptidase [Cyclobacterium jeungdonense]|uniref:Peptidoglycan DD-metalloendopeptidase family protein n=1 Tax=Cyclobacterium jeungdonense TaxID=708087 RepID=A0ABT8CDT3_9BACT|nr:peptidoglycan DD-metalloendopeptidase family protein [Cyclobacterium jeungdonense]MDN3689713.1 peptidoglycan DD-metalloendopeptidase family protein [Cyclobacterium jeungdonense]